ncbi:MAG: HlyD family secretion protein [bacterium]
MSEEAKKNNLNRKVIFIIAFILVIGGAIGSYYFYQHYKSYVSTDNAYIKEDFTVIAPRVGGTVLNVYVKENDYVKKGTVLAEIDPKDFEVKVAQAEMALIMAKNNRDSLYQKLKEADAGIDAKVAELDKARLDYERAKRLYEKQLIPKEQYERAEMGLKVSKARYEAALKEKEQIKASLGARINGEEAIVRHNEAVLKEARQYLGYTKVYAPQDGYIARKTVEIGNVVAAGQPLMALVPLREPYVEANFKETEVGKIKVGNKVKIKIDIYPDEEFEGVVDSISTGTGVVFSLLPPENATGNWIKVVQRVPVKIKFDKIPEDKKLRLGLSCEVKVKVR